MMDKIIELAVNRTQGNTEYLEDTEGIRVITLGTSSPIPSERNQTGIAVFVNGEFFLFDTGYGVIRQAELENLPLPLLSHIFISHWHSDHFIDLPYAINRSWQLGRQHELNVYGPEGIDTVMSGIELFLKYENLHRIAHHGDEVMNPKYAEAVIHTIDASGGVGRVVYDDNGIVITAFSVCHEPIDPSFGFKIEYDDKSVVISGDTREDCDNVDLFAKDADLLLHEVMLKDVMLKGSEVLKNNGNNRNAKILNDIVEYHTSPTDIAIMANEVGVRKLVLYHFAPEPSNLIIERRYKSDITKIYKGPVVLAADGDEFYVN